MGGCEVFCKAIYYLDPIPIEPAWGLLVPVAAGILGFLPILAGILSREVSRIAPPEILRQGEPF